MHLNHWLARVVFPRGDAGEDDDNRRRCALQLLARHSELEQSETKAQAALVMILCFTQITELKLLLDLGRQGHRSAGSEVSRVIGQRV